MGVGGVGVRDSVVGNRTQHDTVPALLPSIDAVVDRLTGVSDAERGLDELDDQELVLAQHLLRDLEEELIVDPMRREHPGPGLRLRGHDLVVRPGFGRTEGAAASPGSTVAGGPPSSAPSGVRIRIRDGVPTSHR